MSSVYRVMQIGIVNVYCRDVVMGSSINDVTLRRGERGFRLMLYDMQGWVREG